MPPYLIRKRNGVWYLYRFADSVYLATVDTFTDAIAELDFELHVLRSEPCS